jgi:membrane protein required for colicin V production
LSEIASRVNWVDLLVLILLIRSCYVGSSRGFGQELFGTIGVLTELMVPIFFYGVIRDIVFLPSVLPSLFVRVLIFLVVVFSILFVFRIIGMIFQKLMSVEFHSHLDKLGGALFGLVRASLWINIILLVLLMLPSDYLTKSITRGSLSGNYFLNIGPVIYAKVSDTLLKDEDKKERADILTSIKRDKAAAKKIEGPEVPKRKRWEKVF